MFIDFILTLWKILDIKHRNSHINLNDPIRKPFRSTDDMRFTFLEDAANAFASMPGGRPTGSKRIMSLTSITRDSLVQTLNGLIFLIKSLLNDKACKYVLPGLFQSDPLEVEFGVY